jgi:hypothetical protein
MHFNSLSVVREKEEFALVKFERGFGCDLFSPAPQHRLDDWRWKLERQRSIAEARLWTQDAPRQGILYFENEFFSFGYDKDLYRTKFQMPFDVMMAFEWLKDEVFCHDLNLKRKRQERYII